MEVGQNSDGTVTMGFDDLMEIADVGHKRITKLTLTAPMKCEHCGLIIPAGSEVHSARGNPVEKVSIIDNGCEWPAVSSLAEVRWTCVCLSCKPAPLPQE